MELRSIQSLEFDLRQCLPLSLVHAPPPKSVTPRHPPPIPLLQVRQGAFGSGGVG
jgi:hypothetical protein